MRCPKCGGTMGFEQFRDRGSGRIPWSYEGWRCIYCGEIIDSLILLNRMMAPTAEKDRVLAGVAGAEEAA